jgi:hypothetical protein
VAYPRFQRARQFKRVLHDIGGTITINSATLAAIGATPDIALAAQVGDVIEVGAGIQAGDSVANSIEFSGATIVSGNPVTYWHGGTNTGSIGHWTIRGGDYHAGGGVILLPPLVAGDIAAGTVTLRLLGRAPTARVIFANSTVPLLWWAKNLGPSDPN